MRALFILLLLLNVGVFAFLALPAAEEPDPYPPRPAAEGLTMVDEETARAAAAEQDDAPEEPEIPDEQPAAPEEPDTVFPSLGDDLPILSEPDAPARDLACLVAPVEDEDTANALLARVQADGLERSRIVTREDQVFVGYWVYIPPHESMQAAQDTMAELGDQGLSDYGYVGGDRYELAVSLGVFSSESRSRNRQNELEELGYETEVGERHRVVTRHAVLIETDDPDPALPDADWQDVDCADYEA